MVNKDSRYEVWLSSLRLNARTIEKLLDRYNTAEEIFFENIELLRLALSQTNDFHKVVSCKDESYIDDYIEKLTREDISFLSICDIHYPKELKLIKRPPRTLYYKGNIQALNPNLSISVVGSRKVTDYGRWACENLVQAFSMRGAHIVSGLAIGVDSIAHKTCINNGGTTIAVLGNGLDNIYPQRNQNLGKDIIIKGLILSEYPPGTPPLPHHFPERNRIISALSKSTCIIEAKEKSGSLITARIAAEQGREVFAVPGNINSLFSRGTNLLIRDGAIPLLDAKQVLDLYPELGEKQKIKKVDLSQYNTDEIQLLDTIKEKPCHIDEICVKLKKPISEVFPMLTLMELEGIVEDIGGQVFTIRI